MEQKISDRLLGAMIGLAKTTGNKPGNEYTAELFVEGLCLLGKTDADTSELFEMIDKIHAERHRLSPDCATCQSPCGNTSDYAMIDIWESGDTKMVDVVRQILGGLVTIAGQTAFLMQRGTIDKTRTDFLCHGLAWLGYDLGIEDLQKLLAEMNPFLQ